MKSRQTTILLALLLYALSASAQQKGDYRSTEVFAKTRSRDAAGKAFYSEWKPFETRLIDSLIGFVPKINSNFSKYGGDKTQQFTSTGFFHTKKVGDRWWVIDPEGYAALHVAVNSINMGKSDRNEEAFLQKFADKDNWSIKTGEMISSLNFNGSGSWSDLAAILKYNETAAQPLAYTINLNFMSSYGKIRGGTYQVPGHLAYPGNAIFVFDPEFEKFCDEYAKQLLTYKDDPSLYGYFSDNEMPLSMRNLEGYLGLENKSDYGYLAAKEWLDSKGITREQITDEHRAEFLALVGEKYFSIVSKAIQKYDPNHMYIGCRFYSGERNVPELMQTAGKYLDIISVNYYGAWTPSQISMNNWAEWANKPFMITEFYTKGEDSGLPNTSGAGWLVKTQEDRGKAYQNFCLGLLENKNCVGWHWFKYQDNDPTQKDAEPSNTDSNKGMVDNNYDLYQPLVEKMNQLNQNRYELIHYFDQFDK